MTRQLGNLGDDTMPLLTEQELRTHGVRIYRPHTSTKPKAGIDWDALTPACSGCGQKSSKLNRDDLCPQCRPAEPPQQEASTGQPTTRRSAPRATQASSSPRRARGAGASAHRKNRPAQRETRPARVGRPGPRGMELDVEAIVEAYTGGQAIIDICRALGTTNERRISAVLVDAGVEIRQGRPSTRAARQPIPRGKPVDESAIVAEYRAGDSAPTIAMRHEILPKRVRAIVERNGVELRDDRATNSGGTPKEYDPELCLQVERLYVREGLSQSQVAERLDLSRKVVATIMQRRGVRARQGENGHQDGAVQLRAQIERLNVLPRTIKLWALQAGLIDRITPGYPSQAVVDAYDTAHGGDV